MRRGEIIQLLKKRSVGITNNRVRLLEFLLSNSERLTSLQEILKNEEKQVTRTSTYRNLIIFCNVGLLYKIVDVNNKAFYSVNTKAEVKQKMGSPMQQEHYHFQCKSCNSITILPQILKSMKLPPGFSQTGSNLLITGYCSECSQKFKQSTTIKRLKNTFSNIMK
jgi:Fur family ferric uptake transcriptional regulator